jgi:aminoglycoside phosphotransferase (APT) family kinase protein
MQPVDLQACLPAALRGATITKIAAGLSGAGVYRVEADGAVYVLKVGVQRPAIQRAAAAAGLAPRIVHVDDERAAIVSELVIDRGFAPLYMTSREHALDLLGATLRRVHELPAEGPPADTHGFLVRIASGLADVALPAFARDVIARVRDEEPPPAEHAPVLGHNDVNPSNIVYDGERVLLLDWDVAGPNDPFHDAATAALFLRMDDAACRRLLALDAVPPRFAYRRRLVGALCGAMFLQLARAGGHAGDAAAGAVSLEEVYARIRAGTLAPGTPDGQWAFGLALLAATAG